MGDNHQDMESNTQPSEASSGNPPPPLPQDPLDQFEARFQELEHKLLEQEHRTLAVWFNFFQSFRRGHEGKRWPALKALIQSLLPGRVMMLVTGGTLIGLVTILLMYQNNLLLLKQNQYFQQQIYSQANTERRRSLVDIKEKLYEATEESERVVSSYDLCVLQGKRNCGEPVWRVPKYNYQTRTESLLAYLDIHNNPLRSPENDELPTLYSLVHDLWESLSQADEFEPQVNEPKDQWSQGCPSSEVNLVGALLSKVQLSKHCLKGMFLYRADLSEAQLDMVDLSGSILWEANLKYADLSASNLQKADLLAANMEKSHLNRVDFQGANLGGVNLKGADVSGAKFLGVRQFSCAQLMQAKNWELARIDIHCPVPPLPLSLRSSP